MGVELRVKALQCDGFALTDLDAPVGFPCGRAARAQQVGASQVRACSTLDDCNLLALPDEKAVGFG